MKTKKLTPNRNNIETYLPVFHGFYGSQWDEPDFYGEAEHFGLPKDFPFWEYLNWQEYKNDLSKAFCSIIEDQLSQYVEKIQFQSLYSPQYYNFTNDSINCIIRPKKQVITKFILEHKEAFEIYLKDHLKSRDGFTSFHSYHWADWFDKTKGFTKFDIDGLDLGFILQFIAEETDKDVEDYDKITNSLIYADSLEIYPSNYYNDSFEKIISALEGIKNIDCVDIDRLNSDSDYTDKLPDIAGMVNEITKFIQDNYINPELEALVISTYSELNECEYINLAKLLFSVRSEIEAKTLKLAI